MNEYYVYEWIRLDTNEPFYVGKGKGKRWRKLRRDGNDYFNNIVNKHPVVVNILHDNLDEETAYGLECYYIWLYRDVIGYDLVNICDGGEGVALCGENNPMYGKDWREGKSEEELKEHKRKVGEANKGKVLSEETKRKIGNAHKGLSCSEKTKKKISKTKIEKGVSKGKNNPMYGKNYRDYMTKEELKEHDRKVSESNRGRNNHKARAIICTTTNEVFFTITEASKYYGISVGNLIGCCKGFVIINGTKYVRNYNGKLPDGTPLKWMYLDEFLNKCEYTLL